MNKTRIKARGPYNPLNISHQLHLKYLDSIRNRKNQYLPKEEKRDDIQVSPSKHQRIKSIKREIEANDRLIEEILTQTENERHLNDFQKQVLAIKKINLEKLHEENGKLYDELQEIKKQ